MPTAPGWPPDYGQYYEKGRGYAPETLLAYPRLRERALADPSSAALCSLPARGLAQSSSDAAAPIQLAPVEVRGQRLGVEQVMRETSTFATTIDTSEATAKVRSVADVLSESVGVQVRRFGGLGAFSTVSIRGSTPNQVEVYLDNVLLNNANAGLVDLGSVPLDNVDHIEIYRGFAPLQLGAGSIGGAINLVTRPVAGATTNSASFSYGSFDTRKISLYRSQGFDKIRLCGPVQLHGKPREFSIF